MGKQVTFLSAKSFPADMHHKFTDVLSSVFMVALAVDCQALGNFNFYKAFEERPSCACMPTQDWNFLCKSTRMCTRASYVKKDFARLFSV